MESLLQYADPSIDWTYAMVTLVVRFIGVFVVMLVMQVALQLASRVVGTLEARQAAAALLAEAPAALRPETSAVPAALQAETSADADPASIDGPTLAAIGLAVALESSSPATSGPGATSNWGIAGRMQQLNRLPR